MPLHECPGKTLLYEQLQCNLIYSPSEQMPALLVVKIENTPLRAIGAGVTDLGARGHNTNL